jgi:hypothetical protein
MDGHQSNVALWIIKILHILFIGFMITAPFVPNMELVTLHFIIVPFLWLHWLTNDSTCFLTLVEKQIRGVDDGKSFFHNLLSPVYLFHKDTVNYGVWTASYLLWLVSLYRLYKEDFKTLKLIMSRTPVLNMVVQSDNKKTTA